MGVSQPANWNSLKNKPSAALAKAWVNFDGSGTGTITPRAAYNVASVTKNGTGDYTVNFSTAMADTNYSATLGSLCVPNGSVYTFGTIHSQAAMLTTSCRFVQAASGGTPGPANASVFCATFHGN